MTSSPRKPRVLHIITGLTVGGAQTFLLDLLPELATDYEIRVVGLYAGALRGEMEARGVPVTELSHRRLVSLPTWRALSRIVAEFRPEIVHTHLGRADVYGRLAARRNGVPVIFTHSQNIENWKKKPLFNWIDNRTMRWNRGIFAVSRRVREFLIERGVAREKITLCYNGLRLEEKLRLPADFSRAALLREFGFTEKDRILTIIARLDEQKGHRFLLPAFERFAAEAPEWRLLIVGGEGRRVGEIRALAARSAAASRIHFAGARRDIPSLLAATDVFILPSLWEGLPLTIVEAMLWERPIIATDVGGVSEAIEHRATGLLIPPGDPDAIFQALRWMRANPDEAAALGRRARATVFERFDIQRAAATIREQYERALAPR